MIYLLVGQPRHGKSQFAAKLAYDIHEQNLKNQKLIDSGKADPDKHVIRKIYSDIDGHAENCEFVEKAPNDWRETPDNSVVFMDEIHLRPEYTDSNGRMSQDQMIVDLTTHGHQNKDIYLITQDPERLNRGIRKLVEKMYLLKRPPQLPPFTSVYVFSRWLRDPWQATKNPDNYHDNYIFKFNKKWQEMYESASKHTSIRFHIQKKFFYAGFAVIAMLTGAYYLFINSGAKDIVKAGLNPTAPTELANTASQSDIEMQKKISTCMEQFQWTEQQCKDIYDHKAREEKNAQLQASTGNSMEQVVIDYEYDPAKPYDVKYTPRFEPKDFPRWENVAVVNGECIPLTQQGTRMQGVSKADCLRFANGDRPFNYYYEAKENRASYEYAAKEVQQEQSAVQNPEVKAEPIPFGTKPPSNINGAHSL